MGDHFNVSFFFRYFFVCLNVYAQEYLSFVCCGLVLMSVFPKVIQHLYKPVHIGLCMYVP